MSLAIYEEPDITTILTQDDSGLSPFRITVDGRVGGTLIYPLYIRNSDLLHYYEDITLSVYDPTGDYTSNNWEWKLIQDRIEPIEEDWGAISNNNTVDIPDIGTTDEGDISTFHPVWLKVIIPRGIDGLNITTLKLRINATKKVVGY